VRHLRQILSEVCGVNAALGPGLSIQTLAGQLAAAAGLQAALQKSQPGMAAALSAWLLAAAVQSWCAKYHHTIERLSGPGHFLLDLHDSRSKLRIPGRVSITRKPAVHEVFSSPRYPKNEHTGCILIPEQKEGWLTPDDESDAARVHTGSNEMDWWSLHFSCGNGPMEWGRPDLQEQVDHPDRVHFVGGTLTKV
jgi:hypothetical protein